jgi:hypothetical protein
MDEAWEAFDNPEFGGPLRIAAAVARDYWSGELAGAGLDAARIAAVFLQLQAIDLPSVSVDAAEAIGHLLQEAVASVAGARGELSERIVIAEEIEGGGVVVRGWGRETALVIFSVAFLLAVAKTGVESENGLTAIHIAQGIPEGFANTLKSVARVLEAAVPGISHPRSEHRGFGEHSQHKAAADDGGKNDAGGPTAGAAVSPDGVAGDAAQPDPARDQVESPPTWASRQALVPIQQVSLVTFVEQRFEAPLQAIQPPSADRVSETEARDLAGIVFGAVVEHFAHAGPATPDQAVTLSVDPDGFHYEGHWLQRNQYEGPRQRVYRKTWEDPAWGLASWPFSLAVGMLLDSEKGLFRLAVRVQSPRPLSRLARDKIAGVFKQWGKDDFVSLRFTSPVHCLSDGAPAAVAERGGGALTLLLKKDDTRYALANGHAISNGGFGKIGMKVYCPPPDTALDKLLLGTIEDLETLPELPLTRRLLIPAVPTRDYALIKLERAKEPVRGDERLMGKGAYHSGTRLIAPLQNGNRVFKVAARTALVGGDVRATGVYVAMQDLSNGQMVYGNNLVEIVLDDNKEVLAGDSGALVYCHENGLHPAATVIAGARSVWFDRSARHPRQLVYAQPLSALDLPDGMELV